MTKELPLWMQVPTYAARLDRALIAALLNEGVVSGLLVAQRGAGANMSVDVSLGSAIIAGDDQTNQGSYLLSSTATENVVVGAAPGSNSRIDVIYARVNDTNAGGPAGDDWTLGIAAGTPGASPAIPATPSSAIALAQVLVAAGTVAITTAMITDVRVASRLIGTPDFGTAEPFFGAEADIPSDRKLANGQAISRTTYFGAFRKLGVVHGSGDGSTTFNLPDLRGRAPFGLDNAGGSDAGRLAVANTLGLTGGAETITLALTEVPAHTHTTPGHTHTTADHTHTIDHNHGSVTSSTESASHSHLYTVLLAYGGSSTGPSDFTSATSGTDSTGAASNTHTHTVDLPNFTGNSGASGAGTTGTGGSSSTGSVGDGNAHSNMPPYILCNWVIRVL